MLSVGLGLGWGAFGIALILAVVEVTFSFDNAIINAKVLARVSPFWQTVFLSVGIIIAIFGMRVVFPIVIVMVTAGLSWGKVLDLALHHPGQYAHHLELAHPTIAAFGGAFLLLLALHFFFDDERPVLWLEWLERPLQRLSGWWGAPLVAAVIIVALALLPANTHAEQTLVAGILGAATYILIQLGVHLLERLQPPTGGHQTGLAALTTLLYLEVLDASFSFDGVIGAFAVTSSVLLIAAGLGIGALWVRSLTVFMVRRGTLNEYRYLEHGAHYTVFVLAAILFAGIIWDISDYVPGLVGMGIIGSSVVASLRARKKLTD